MQDEKHLSSGKAPSPHCDLRSFLRPRYISSVREVHLREEQILKIPMSVMAAAAGLTLLTLPAAADTMTFKAPLSASEEVAAEPEQRNGEYRGNIRYIIEETVLQGLLFRTDRFCHRGAFPRAGRKGKNAGVAAPVDAAKSPFEGSATLTDAQAGDLTKGDWYFKVHTAENKGGEIRGQMTKGP
jgi:hypothetical protein